MNKLQFLLTSNSVASIYSSTIAKTSSNLFYASRERNHIYIKGKNLNFAEISINGTILGSFIPDANNEIYVDISDIIETIEGEINVPMYIALADIDYHYTTINYNVAVCSGYSYGNFARNLDIADLNCQNQKLVRYNYSASNINSYILLPTRIIIPRSNGVSMFSFSVTLPVWHYEYGASNVALYSTTSDALIGRANDKYLPMMITTSNIDCKIGLLRVTGSSYGRVELIEMSNHSRYCALRWVCPYTKHVENPTAPITSNVTAYNCIAYFEVFSMKTNTEITTLQSTPSQYLYKVGRVTEIEIGMRNLDAYSYIYYSQILLSEDIAILLSNNTSSSFFQSAKLKKTNITYPTNNTVRQDLRLQLIIEE